MQNELWLNASSKDLIKAKEFFQKIGFAIDETYSNAGMLSLRVGSNKVVLNLFPEASFKMFTNNAINNSKETTEVLFSIGAGSPAEVDELARKAVDAGGVLYAKPGEKDGWMYGCGFSDLDGHRWNVLFMDMSKLPKG